MHERYLPECRDIVINDRKAKLTPRKTEVLSLLAQGYSDTEIAKILLISPSAVGIHNNAPEVGIYSQLSVCTRVQAAATAISEKLIDTKSLAKSFNFYREGYLSPQEKKVFNAITDPNNYQTKLSWIAKDLGITTQVLKNECTFVFKILGVKGRVGAVAFALLKPKE